MPPDDKALRAAGTRESLLRTMTGTIRFFDAVATRTRSDNCALLGLALNLRPGEVTDIRVRSASG